MAVHKRHSIMSQYCFDFLILPRTSKSSESRDTSSSITKKVNHPAADKHHTETDHQATNHSKAQCGVTPNEALKPVHPTSTDETMKETYLRELVENNNNTALQVHSSHPNIAVEYASNVGLTSTEREDEDDLAMETEHDSQRILEHAASVLACEIEPSTLLSYHERRCRKGRGTKACKKSPNSSQLSYDHIHSLLMTIIEQPSSEEFRQFSSMLHSVENSKYIATFFDTLGALQRLSPHLEEDCYSPTVDSFSIEQISNTSAPSTSHICGGSRDERSKKASRPAMSSKFNTLDVQYINRHTRALQNFNKIVEIKKQKQQQRLFNIYSNQARQGNVAISYIGLNTEAPIDTNARENTCISSRNTPDKQNKNKENSSINQQNYSTGSPVRNHQNSPINRCSDTKLDLHSSNNANTNHIGHDLYKSINRNGLTENDDRSDLYIPVSSVKLHHKCLCDRSMRRLEQILEDNSCVRSLSLSGARFDGPALLRISRVIEWTQGLHEVVLSSSEIGDDGAMFIASALRVNQTIHTLDLSDNGITSMGARFISRALMRNRTLSSLDLSKNSIGSRGCRAMVDPLSIPGCSLRKLSLGNNHIMDDGLSVLFKALRRNFKLLYLDISDNTAAERTKAVLLDVMLVNRTLRQIRADRCGLNEYKTIPCKHPQIIIEAELKT